MTIRKHKIDQDWTIEELAILKENYCKPDGPKIIQTLLPHRGYNSIKGMANVNGLKRRPVFSKNLDFFSTPNDQNCVIGGFLAADGCITGKQYNRVNITLCEKDRPYLEIIRQLVEYTGEIYTYQPALKKMTPAGFNKEYTIGHNKIVTLQIGQCDKWISDLNKHWNITPRKTYTLQPPNLMNLRHILCYLSGLIDGDGWVCINNKPDALHGKVLEISVMGTESLMHWVKHVFDYITPDQTDAIVKKTGEHSWAISLRGMRAYIVAKVFLSLDILRLDRKWNYAREYIALLEQSGGMSPKMATYLRKTGFDQTLINRLQIEEILLPIV